MPDPKHLDAALGWFVRLRDETANPEANEAFKAWIAADPAHDDAYRAVERMWRADAFDAALRRAKSRLDKPAAGPQGRVWKSAALAASILIVLGAAVLAPDAVTRLQADSVAEVGQQRNVALADGSRVLLNTDSAIAVDMDGPDRNVRLLKGEAFFDVIPDATRPFHVRGGGADVRVVGTAFAVRLDKEATTVTVRQGRVQVSGGANASVTLDPGQQARLKASGLTEPYPADMASSLAWTDQRLIFEDRALGEVIDEIARYHPGVILIANERLRSVRVGGNYRLTDPVAALAAIAQIASADLVRISDYVLILR